MKTFRLHKVLTLPLAVSLLMTASTFNESSGQRRNQPAKRPPASESRTGTTLFVVSGRQDDVGPEINYGMDALVTINDGKYLDPVGDGDISKMKPFAEKYFQVGRQYRLLFGGGEVGSATVESSSEGCNVIHSSIKVKTSVWINDRIQGLATDSEILGKKASSRRALTPVERAAVLRLVKNIYRQHKTSQALLGKLVVHNLTATDLDGDGKLEVVGSFIISYGPGQIESARRDLFLIAKPSGAGYRAELAKFQAYTMDDGFGRGVAFVDQLDMDGDGVAEVVTQNEGFDGYAYSIYKKRGGVWREIYSVMGDAC